MVRTEIQLVRMEVPFCSIEFVLKYEQDMKLSTNVSSNLEFSARGFDTAYESMEFVSELLRI